VQDTGFARILLPRGTAQGLARPEYRRPGIVRYRITQCWSGWLTNPPPAIAVPFISYSDTSPLSCRHSMSE
jgi:hypothetical protein